MDKVRFYASISSCLLKEYSTKFRLHLKIPRDSAASEENKGSRAEKASLYI